MSKFHTSIPIDIDAAFAKLPVGSRVVNYSLDQASRQLAVEWENDKLLTPYNVPIPFPLEDLRIGKIPPYTNSWVDWGSAAPAPQTPTPVEKPAEIPTFNDKVTLDKAPEKRKQSRTK